MLNIKGAGGAGRPSRNQSDSDGTKGRGATDHIQGWAFVKKSLHEQSGLLNPQRLQFSAAWMIGELIECKVPQIPSQNYSWFYRSRLPLRIPLSKTERMLRSVFDASPTAYCAAPDYPTWLMGKTHYLAKFIVRNRNRSKLCRAWCSFRFELKYDQARVPEQATGAALQLFKETRVGFQPPESRP